MKKIACLAVFMLTLSALIPPPAGAQTTGRLTVSTRLMETAGTYEERKLYRRFLEDCMVKCPYISHFKIEEAPSGTDNHAVIWHYEVNGWDGITHFYDWIHLQLKDQAGSLKTAMTPYAPAYAIGGEIQATPGTRSRLAGSRRQAIDSSKS